MSAKTDLTTIGNMWCSGAQQSDAPIETTLAAALGTNTLVVTAQDGIHVLSLTDGTEQWHGTPTSVTGPVRNPVIVGHTLYVIDTGAGSSGQLVALTSH